MTAADIKRHSSIGAQLALLFVCAFFSQSACSNGAEAQDSSETGKIIRAVANGVLHDATFMFVGQKGEQRFTSAADALAGSQLRLESRYTDWRYWNGVLNIAMIRVGDVLADSTYRRFSEKNVAFSFDNYQYFKEKYAGESKWEYPFAQQFIMEELDDCGAMGASVIEVYRRTSQERYLAYIHEAAEHILTRQQRLEDGTLVRSFPRKWTLWADDLYMSVSFLSRMGELTGDRSYFDDAALQVINFQKHLFDENAGLMYHCWYSDQNQHGVAFWGRANGWAMLAQVDLLDRLPKDHAQRDTLLRLLRRHIVGVTRCQGSEGLWHQLLDKSDSYLETSCSAMFTYAIARGVNKGYIDSNFASIARRGWRGVMSRIGPDGQIEGVCTGTSVGDDLSYYYQRPAPPNDVHGIGAVLLAGTEILQMKK